MRTPLSLLAAAVLLQACAGTGSPAPIVDGSDGLRLGVRTVGGGMMSVGQTLFSAGGWDFLYVDGHGRYWVRTGDLWNETHTGTLDAADEAALRTAVHYGEWDGLSGSWSAGIADASSLELFSARTSISCSAFCEKTNAPQVLKDVQAGLSSVLLPLWQKGAPMTGDVRAAASLADAGSTAYVPHASWPLATPISDLVGGGVGVRFSGSDAAALRDLRTVYLSGPYRTAGVEGLPVDAGADVNLLYVRDVLPFEDASGKVSRP